ncbi:hypothetical protein CRUP_028229 [Coryphaenoides rupestris]|nr:hypothetical protein CRUP_028229 [Coryphaenoides rupestris]
MDQPDGTNLEEGDQLMGTEADRDGCSRGLRATWLGHSTVLVELDGVNLLTDPIFSQRASPVQFVGPKRYRGPPCTVEQLPRIDAVVISHSHYDHLDAGTWLRRAGCEDVTELDWWERSRVGVPGRDDDDDDDDAAGGYCSAFTEIGCRFGPFDLAAIPIGAYLPRDVMVGQHVDPEQAVQIHTDVRAKCSLAVHWGTFALAYEPYLEPPVRLREALRQRGLDPDCFFTLHHGESWPLAATEGDDRSRSGSQTT